MLLQHPGQRPTRRLPLQELLWKLLLLLGWSPGRTPAVEAAERATEEGNQRSVETGKALYAELSGLRLGSRVRRSRPWAGMRQKPGTWTP